MDLQTIGRALLIFGLVLALVGGLVMLGGRIPFLGRLPGDISFRWGGGWFYFPIVTSLLLSVVLTIVLNILVRLFNRS